MKALGIIAEYNPFHKGHLLHLEKSKEITGLPVIAVMSGSIMQRGEIAFADKWMRARIAVECGVDLVLELPTVFSLQSAEYFALGGTRILEATGLVSVLSCGAENSELDFTALAKASKIPENQAKIHQLVATGISFAKANELALGSSATIAANPNNILALEYAKALLGTNISQLVIRREGHGYNDEALGHLASATAIRKAYSKNLDWQSNLPAAAAELLDSYQQSGFLGYDSKALWQILSYKLWTSTVQDIALVSQCTEGLENLLHEALGCPSFEEAVNYCTNKRYTSSRIRRLLYQLLLAKPKDYYNQKAPAYIRILAFNEVGRQLLAEMKRTATLPILTKIGKNCLYSQSEAFRKQLELDITASNIAALLRPCRQPYASDFYNSPYYKK